ncbi:MAG: hypothetical protein Q9212_003430 [Teloschistes hypoglaucus]
MGSVSDARKDYAFVEGADIPGPAKSMGAFFAESAQQHGDQDALICLDQAAHTVPAPLRYGEKAIGSSDRVVWTYSQLHRSASQLAAWFSSRAIRRGTSIVVFMDSGLEFTLTLWAAALLRAVFIPLDPRSVDRPEVLAHYLTTVHPSAILVSDQAALARLECHCPEKLREVKAFISARGLSDSRPNGLCSLAEALATEQHGSFEDEASQELGDGDEDAAFVLFTSGTTSMPKGCLHTTRTIWHTTWHPSAPEGQPSPRISHLLLLPTFHVAGLIILIGALRAGSKVVISHAALDPRAVMDVILNDKITHMCVYPLVASALIDHSKLARPDLSALTVSLGASAASPETLKDCMDPSKLGARGALIRYGLTEGVPLVATNPKESLPIHDGHASVGRIMPGSKVKICEPGTRRPLFCGDTGEVHVGGPKVIGKYVDCESDSLYADDEGCRWHATGDQGLIDASGNIFILGRYKDLIIRGGKNISPAATEHCLQKISAIETYLRAFGSLRQDRDAQVVGIPDAISGEVPVAVVRMAFGCGPAVTALKGHVAKEIGDPAVPVAILTLEELALKDYPKTAVGKVKKNVLGRVVQDYLKQSEFNEEPKEHQPTEAYIAGIWSRLVRIPRGKLSHHSSIIEEADSLMIARFQGEVRNHFDVDMGLDVLQKHSSVRAQAQYLDAQGTARKELDSSAPVVPTIRRGPPTTYDMAHDEGHADRAQRTKEIAASLLGELGLNWDTDVEDVLPIPDFPRHFLIKKRTYSWNLRLSCAYKCSDPELVRRALQKSLSTWPILRTLHVVFDQECELFLVMRPSQGWYDLFLSPTAEVRDVDELQMLRSSILQSAISPGPLFRAQVVKVKDTGTVHIVAMFHHSIYDSLSLPLWLRDLGKLLHDPEATLSPKLSYKHFADLYYNHRNSPIAQISIDYHVERMRGLSTLKSCMWPPLRRPGRFTNNDEGWLHEDGTPGRAEDRQPLNVDRSLATWGATGTMSVPNVRALKTEHGIAPSTTLKAALALASMVMTGQDTAVLSNVQAGRQWPFVDDFIARRLPSPVTIAGPTLTSVVNRFAIDDPAAATVLSFLRDAESEQALLTKHSHAPLSQIRKALSDADRAVYDEAMSGLCYNWLPEWQTPRTHDDHRNMDEEEGEIATGLKVVSAELHTDRVAVLQCGLVSEEEASVTMRYDDCQIGAQEAERALRVFGMCAGWVCDRENWERGLKEGIEELRGKGGLC